MLVVSLLSNLAFAALVGGIVGLRRSSAGAAARWTFGLLALFIASDIVSTIGYALTQ